MNNDPRHEHHRHEHHMHPIEPLQRCELCGTIAETRPYGLNHEEICAPCGMLDPSVTEMRMKQGHYFKDLWIIVD